MSYCRFGPDSDVYVIGTRRSQPIPAMEEFLQVPTYEVFECCGCNMTPTEKCPPDCGEVWCWGFKYTQDFFHTPSRAAMIEHLGEHTRMGHKVPEEAVQRLREDTSWGES